jgi:hypothetical protein
LSGQTTLDNQALIAKKAYAENTKVSVNLQVRGNHTLQSWFVDAKITFKETSVTERKRFYEGFSVLKSVSEKQYHADSSLRKLIKRVKAGETLLEDKNEKPCKPKPLYAGKTLKGQFERFYELQSPNWRTKTLSDFKNIHKKL